MKTYEIKTLPANEANNTEGIDFQGFKLFFPRDLEIEPGILAPTLLREGGKVYPAFLVIYPKPDILATTIIVRKSALDLTASDAGIVTLTSPAKEELRAKIESESVIILK